MKYLIPLFLSIIICNKSFGQDNWSFVKESSIKDNISGTVSRGYVFKVGSSEYYVVNENTRQRVRIRNPDVKIYQNGLDYKLVIDDFDDPVICLKLRSVISERIDGEFIGWSGDTIFKLLNGQIWQQAAYSYLYHYAYSPEVLIYEFGGNYKMKVEDVDEIVDVKQVNTKASTSKIEQAVDSRIDGEFKGWDGETIFKLVNGQIWQQSGYAYYYHYAYSPKVLIYPSDSGYWLKVDGVDSKIHVKRLK